VTTPVKCQSLIEQELVERERLFVSADDKFPSLYKNWLLSKRKSRDWVKHRWKYLKGIHRFHRSTNGKKFHRQLGRFLSTRFFEGQEDSSFTLTEALIAVSSAKTHLLLELLYDMPVMEKIEYEFFVDYAHDHLTNIEKKLYERKTLNEEEKEFLGRLVLNGSNNS
jgi:hypothetical protein